MPLLKFNGRNGPIYMMSPRMHSGPGTGWRLAPKYVASP
jgi:hypothetical protein